MSGIKLVGCEEEMEILKSQFATSTRGDLGTKWFAFSKMEISAAEMLANLKKVKRG